jgi:hypothetical protein
LNLSKWFGRSRSGLGAALALFIAIAVSAAAAPIRAQTTEAPAAAAAQTPQSTSHNTQSPQGGGGYFVEFRAAEIGAYGHSYAVYGNVGGRPNYADLHPMGNYAIMALGHVLPVPANTQWDPDVLKLPVSSRFRRNLNAEQYRKLLAAVSAAKANKAPYWNAVTNNCNHFIGHLAQAIGLKVPAEFQLSYAFVPALKELNDGGSGGTVKPSRQRRAAAPPPS